MKKVLILLLVIAVGVVIIFVFRPKEEPEQLVPDEVSRDVGTGIGDIAPEFEANTYDGKTVKLSDYKGTPVFINFWAAWCPFCVDELPLMAEVQKEHGEEYVTLAVNRGEDLSTARKFSDELNVTDTMLFLLNEKDDIYRRYGGFAMPYSLFLDKEGVIVDVKRGPLTREELEEKINKILN